MVFPSNNGVFEGFVEYCRAFRPFLREARAFRPTRSSIRRRCCLTGAAEGVLPERAFCLEALYKLAHQLDIRLSRPERRFSIGSGDVVPAFFSGAPVSEPTPSRYDFQISRSYPPSSEIRFSHPRLKVPSARSTTTVQSRPDPPGSGRRRETELDRYLFSALRSVRSSTSDRTSSATPGEAFSSSWS